MMIIKAGVSTLNSTPGGVPSPQQLSNLITSTATAAGIPAAIRDQDTGREAMHEKNSLDTSSIAFRMPAAQQMEHQQHSIQNASSTEAGMITEQQMNPPAAWHSG